MSGARTVALGVGAFIAAMIGALAHADPMSSTGGYWVWYSANGVGSTGDSSLSRDVSSIVNALETVSGAAAPSPVSTPAAAPSSVQANPIVTNVATPPAPSSAPAAPPPPPIYDARINLGAGPYPDDSLITTGGTQPWYQSGLLPRLFGGTPGAQQQADFDNAVLQRVEQTFRLSGVPITLTDDPNAPAAHTLSVVSNTSSRLLGNAIGMTELGGSGFSFIDRIAPSAQSLDQLEWIVAHNVSHELMLAFGVGEKYDQSGNYIDATTASWGMITSPNATFSPGAAQALLSQNFLLSSDPAAGQGAQLEGPQPVPEPGTVALWGLVVLAVALRGAAGRLKSSTSDFRTKSGLLRR
jgi:hypothetical protein